MKKFITLVSALFVALAIVGVSHAEPSDRQLLEERIKLLSQAMVSADADALKELTSPQLSYGHSSGRVEDQTTFIGNLLNGSSDFVTIELQDQQLAVMDNIAIVRHTLSAETRDGGKPGLVKIGVMLVWKNSADQWQLVARQAFKL